MKSSALVKTEPRKGKSNSAAMAVVEKVLLAVKLTVQAVKEMEPKVADAALVCLRHCMEHSDAMPADRLIKGLAEYPHPLTKSMSLELVAWFRQSSPIRWDSKGNVHVLKEGDEGYTPFNAEKAEKEAFNETTQAKRARAMADAAQKKGLEPVTFKQFAKRFGPEGLSRWLQQVTSPSDNGDEARGFKSTTEARKIKKAIRAMSDAYTEAFGEADAA